MSIQRLPAGRTQHNFLRVQVRLDHQEETLRVAGEQVDGSAHSSLQVEITGQQNDDPPGGLRDGVERISHLEASVTNRAGECESGLLGRRDHANRGRRR